MPDNLVRFKRGEKIKMNKKMSLSLKEIEDEMSEEENGSRDEIIVCTEWSSIIY